MNLGFGNDLDGNLLALQLAFLGSGNSGIPKMPSPNLFAKLILIGKMLREPEPFIQTRTRTRTRFASFWNRIAGGVGFNGSLPPGQHRPYMLRRRRWRKRPLKETFRGGIRAAIGRRRRPQRGFFREEVVSRARTVDPEERRLLRRRILAGIQRRRWILNGVPVIGVVGFRRRFRSANTHFTLSSASTPPSRISQKSADFQSMTAIAGFSG